MSLTYGSQREATDAELPEVRKEDLWYCSCMSEPRGSGQFSTSCRKTCICPSACSYHPWSLRYVVDAAARAHTDWVTVLWIGWCGLKLFSNWPELESQREVSLSWCHTAAASPPQNTQVLGCSPVVFTWKGRVLLMQRAWMNLSPHLIKKGSKSQHPKRFGIMRSLRLKNLYPIQWLNRLDKWKRSSCRYWLWYLGMRNLYVIICAGGQNHDECLI